MSTADNTTEPAQTETETETEILTDGGSREAGNPAKALLEDAAGL